MAAIAVIDNRQSIAQAQKFSAQLFRDFVDYIDRCDKTTRTYLTNLRQFMAWMKYADIRQPARQDIISYRDWLTTEHEAIQLDASSADGWSYRTDRNGCRQLIRCTINTIRGYLRSVCQFFKWTAANNLYPNIADNIHSPKIDTQQHKKEFFTADQVQAIESSIAQKAQEHTAATADAVKDKAGRMQRSTEQGKRLYAMYVLTVNAGLRTIEISRANVKDIRVKGGQAILYVWGKGRNEPDQKKPLAPEVHAAIKDYLSSRTDHPTGNSPLFVSTGNRSKGKRIAPTTISTMLKEAMKEAGFDSDNLTAHSLRHTAAMGVLKTTGNNIYETQKYCRHSSPDTTMHYIHETQEQIEAQADIAQRLYDLYHNIATPSTGTDKLINAAAKLTPEQREQLASIAAAMAR